LLFWFRNDLRTHDNSALHYFLSQPSLEKQRKAIFFVSKKQWRSHNWSELKIDLILRHAKYLEAKLTRLGLQLNIVEVDDFEQQKHYLLNYCNSHNISEVIANSEVEFHEQRRDKDLIESGLNLRLFESDVIVPKGRLRNQSGGMFKVFTPFKRAWLNYVHSNGFDYLGKAENAFKNCDGVQSSSESHQASCSQAWPLAHIIEHETLPTFFDDKLENYKRDRDIPSIKGTSGISPYLAAGLISPRYLLRLILNRWPDLLLASDSDNFCWLNEIIWRDFYRHVLFHRPDLSKHQCFNTKYQNVKWENNIEYFNAWKQGHTGYPIIDAAMRQLNKTGWMHNRLRMLTASFLTKHLLIDWRWGEQYFMQNLIDGDLAANNGGWQWSASTGCDAQPYFRIFNPIRQSEKFDPSGHFIRKYLPELRDIPSKEIHFPHEYLQKHKTDIYWPAIVEHKEARDKAISFYQAIEKNREMK